MGKEGRTKQWYCTCGKMFPQNNFGNKITILCIIFFNAHSIIFTLTYKQMHKENKFMFKIFYFSQIKIKTFHGTVVYCSRGLCVMCVL